MAEAPIHSMSLRDRELARTVLCAAWEHLAAAPAIAHAVHAAAAALPTLDPTVDADYARYAADAALWYLDRAVRRLGDADRSGLTAELRAANLAWFSARAASDDVERLFAMAVALNADDA
jgi:hypothetical protein